MITVVCRRTLLLLAALTLAALLMGLTLTLFFADRVAAAPVAEPNPPPQPVNWVTECALCPRWFADMMPQAAQTDPDGVVHVVYGGDGLYHAWSTPTGWLTEVADPSPGVGRYAVLAIDASGGLHAVYWDDVMKVLRYAARQAGVWRTEPIVSLTLAADLFRNNPYPSLAVTPDGTPRVAFYRPAAYNLAYAERTPSGWQVQTVDVPTPEPGNPQYGGAGVGQFASLALDSTGKAHIAYYDAIRFRLRYAMQTDTGWQIELVEPITDPVQSLGQDVSLALDAADRPHIVTRLSSSLAPHVVYLIKQAGAWQVEQLPGECQALALPIQVSISDCGTHAVLRLSPDGTVHVAYVFSYAGAHGWYYLNGARPRHLVRTSAGWTVNESEVEGAQTLLALDGTGAPVVFAFDKQVLTAYRPAGVAPGTAWPGTTVDTGGDPGPQTALAIDQAGQVHLAALDAAAEQLRYTVRAGSGWQPPSGPGLTPIIHANVHLALNPQGAPRLLYADTVHFPPYLGPTGMLKYTRPWGSDWLTELRSVTGSTAAALAEDLAGVSHMAFVSDGALNYVVGALDGTPVQIDKRVDVGPRGPATFLIGPVALAVDARRIPHIAYFYNEARDLPGTVRYATLRGETWITETIAPAPYEPLSSQRIALALGPGGVPQVVFAGEQTGINLARRVNGRWQANQVAAYPPAEQPALAVDAGGAAHISFYDSAGGSLRYTRVEPDGSALTSLVAAGGYAGQGSAIAVDGAGFPHITYYDALNHDVRHAYVPLLLPDSAYLPAVRK